MGQLLIGRMYEQDDRRAEALHHHEAALKVAQEAKAADLEQSASAYIRELTGGP
jgi:hypothetical protein